MGVRGDKEGAAALPRSSDSIAPAQSDVGELSSTKSQDPEKGFEVFRETEDGVNFRTLGWPWASIIFLKRASCVPGNAPVGSSTC